MVTYFVLKMASLFTKGIQQVICLEKDNLVYFHKEWKSCLKWYMTLALVGVLCFRDQKVSNLFHKLHQWEMVSGGLKFYGH